jgi:hypothetical protein
MNENHHKKVSPPSKLIIHHISIKVNCRKKEGDPSLALGMTGM